MTLQCHHHSQRVSEWVSECVRVRVCVCVCVQAIYASDQTNSHRNSVFFCLHLQFSRHHRSASLRRGRPRDSAGLEVTSASQHPGHGYRPVVSALCIYCIYSRKMDFYIVSAALWYFIPLYLVIQTLRFIVANADFTLLWARMFGRKPGILHVVFFHGIMDYKHSKYCPLFDLAWSVVA